MRQVTIVALYGQKPTELVDILGNCQKIVATETAAHPGIAFEPYEMEQVHATLVGLERKIGSAMHNLNFTKWRNGAQKVMDFAGLLRYMREGAPFPFAVQIGGYQNRDYPFTSRNDTPYSRSFSVQGDKAVVMGWPLFGDPNAPLPQGSSSCVVESRRYPGVLDELRRQCQAFGVLHGWHRDRTDVDNDFYLRIGLFDTTPVPPSLTTAIRTKVQAYLSGLSPIPTVEVSHTDVFIAAYEDETLPLKTTSVWSLADPTVDESFVRGLYS